MDIQQTPIGSINEIMQRSFEAFGAYRKKSPEDHAIFLERIAEEMENMGDELINQASAETNLPYQRLLGERNRTTGQLRSFAAMVREGNWVDATIDTAQPDRKPIPKPDIRKMMVPLGPVIVFGASNFPFAYSTAGGDTAAALAAGCSVVVKAHEAHAKTSGMVALAISHAAQASQMPEHVFQHVYGSGKEVGKTLVQHPLTAAVGFTGSHSGGRALFDYAAERKSLIPVFSEMGSTNPVIFLPETLKNNSEQLAELYAGSITQSSGQFCTNPGILLGIQSPEFDRFAELLAQKIAEVPAAKMLHENIFQSFCAQRDKVLQHPSVTGLNNTTKVDVLEAAPLVARTTGAAFLSDTWLGDEVFGPFSILISCANEEELRTVWLSLTGQLTTTIMGTDNDFTAYSELIMLARNIAGRVIFNGVPTGVEVCPSMVHGGPYPATTDSRFTAVGIQSIKRWIRPVCFQNAPESLLPPELRNSNERNIWRLVNNTWTKESLAS